MSSAMNDDASAIHHPIANLAPDDPVSLVRLRGFSRGIGYFWQGISYVFLLSVLAAVFAQQPQLIAQPRGWAILVLSVVFGAWYYVGFTRLLDASHDSHWQALMRTSLPLDAWRGFVVWAVALALNLALYALNPDFKWMLWSVYGVSFAVWPLPYALALFTPTAAAIFVTQSWLPTNWQPMSIIWFIISVAMFCIYTAMAYLPFILLKGRFDRERVFADLEASHRALAEAHRQLEAASARDREWAALRERGRIARDMHDTLGHSLALIAVKLDAAQRLRGVDGARADREIVGAQGAARAALAELRATLAELRAALPEQAPLGEALARLARETGERAGWHVTYDITPDLDDLGDLGDHNALDDPAYAALLRVGAEALTNAERHAHAHNVTLTLAREGCDVLLRVQDDGVGILTTNPPIASRRREASRAQMVAVGAPSAAASVSANRASEAAPGDNADDESEAGAPSEANVVIESPQGHYGVTGMRERMAEVGGRFSIGPACDDASDGRTPHGTVVEARVPMRGL